MNANNLTVVIGAASGMGRAVAARFAADGPLLLADRSVAGLATVEAELGRDADVTCIPLDITDAAAVNALVEQTGDSFSSLIITAGLSPTMGTCAQIIEVNLVGMARLLDAFTSLAVEGSVAVCLASTAGHFGIEPAVGAVLDDPSAPDLLERLAAVSPAALADTGMAYMASKTGVIRLARRTAVAWGPRGARVVSISPGIIDTPMGAQEMAHQAMMPMMVENTPLRRQGRAEEIAEVAHFLCSPQASFVNGCDLLVDGGSDGWVKTMMAQAGTI